MWKNSALVARKPSNGHFGQLPSASGGSHGAASAVSPTPARAFSVQPPRCTGSTSACFSGSGKIAGCVGIVAAARPVSIVGVAWRPWEVPDRSPGLSFIRYGPPAPQNLWQIPAKSRASPDLMDRPLHMLRPALAAGQHHLFGFAQLSRPQINALFERKRCSVGAQDPATART
jgi:hypothetical protein